MTEHQWLKTIEVPKMLDRIGNARPCWWTRLGSLGRNRGPAIVEVPTKRKLKLFVAATCRPLIPLLGAEGLTWVEKVEELADEIDGNQQHSEDSVRFWNLLDEERSRDHWPREDARCEALQALALGAILVPYSLPDHGCHLAVYAAKQAAWHACRAVEIQAGPTKCVAARDWSWRYQADALRDIVGNPFRRPILDQSWRLWRNDTIGCLARAIYVDRGFDRMPILGDALEEAGCERSGILSHCRAPMQHVRGCWVLDLLLGK